jgi:hypothetical protein
MSREIRRFDVYFKDPNACYKAGDVVAGSVQLDLGQELKLKGIRLALHGIARVHWDESRAYTKGSASKLSHKNMDVYLDEQMIILRKSDGSGLAAGRYDWPFTIRLPPYLPASFEGQHGRVMYWAKALIERPWKGDSDVSKPFTVAGSLDLNTENDAKKPIDGYGEAMAGFSCCKSGPITGHLALSKRGFVCGENLPFEVQLQNSSSKKLSAVRVTLSQQVTFRADKRVRKTVTLLKGMTRGDVSPGENITWEDEIKNIPPVPPTRLGGGCKNIEVKYMVTLVATPSGPGKALEVPVEVTIGTVPLRKTESGEPLLTVKAAAKKRESVDLLVAGTKRPSPRPSPRQSLAN